MTSNVVSIYLCQTDAPNQKYRVVLASAELSQFDDLGLDASEFEGIANLYRCPIGADPGIANLLMTRDEVEKLDDSTDHTLVMRVGEDQVDIQGLYLRTAKRLLTGRSQDVRSLYLVELADKRWLLNRLGCISRRYNVRDLEQTDSQYRMGTAKDASGTPWTWEEVFENLWNSCTISILGDYWFTGFQDEVNSTPENLFYQDMTPFAALCDCVRRVGCEVVYDPQDGTFRIVQMGTYDAGADTVADTLIDQGGVWSADSGPQWNDFCASQTTRVSGDRLMEDDEYFVGRHQFPQYVRVVFPANFPASTVNGATYSISVASDSLPGLGDWWEGIPNPSSELIEDYIHDTMQARFSSEDSDEVLNLEDLNERAVELATLHFRRIISGTPSCLVYSGIRAVSPGRHVHSSAWGEIGHGLKTWIERHIPAPIQSMPRPEKTPQLIKKVKILGVWMSVSQSVEGAVPELDEEGEIVEPGVNCEQKITMWRSSIEVPLTQAVRDTLGGEWQLKILLPDSTAAYKGAGPLDYDASAADIQAAIEGIEGIEPGDVTCTGGPIHENSVTVEFTGDLGEQPIHLMVAEYGMITGGYDPTDLLHSSDSGLTVLPCQTAGYAVISAAVLNSTWAVGLNGIANRVGSDWWLVVPGGTWTGYVTDDMLAAEITGSTATAFIIGATNGKIVISEIGEEDLPAKNYTSAVISIKDWVYASPIAGYWHSSPIQCQDEGA